MLTDFAAVANAISATRKKLEKEAILAEYFRRLDDPSLERAAVFFTGSPFPKRDERVSGVGWSTIFDAVVSATGADPAALSAATQREGDLGDAVAEVFPAEASPQLSVLELGEFIDRLATTAGSGNKLDLLVQLFGRASQQEARYIVKLLQNEFRIGLQEGLVESAIARAFAQEVSLVRRAHMFNGDLGVTALLARSGALESAEMTLFHPIGFMLAQPEETAEDLFAQLGGGAIADDKYDGIRAQIHFDGTTARIYSRTLDEITSRFPEVSEAVPAIGRPIILDGEIVAYKDRILPFAILQSRIGRKVISAKLLESAPVVFFAFDLLYLDGAPLFEKPLKDRLDQLREVLSVDGVIRLGFQKFVHSPEEIDVAFDEARRRSNEGLVLKNPESLYTPGRRGKAWLKYKKALATLDCVVTAAEYGHGKRKGVLSDYTFAIRRDGEFVNIGKAYSGVTDAEIEMLTRKFTAITTGRYGPVHVVEPEVVLEIAFDRLQESKRHKSGFAMRFPRIARIRDDKTVDEISTIDDVRRIYEGQLARENPEE